MAQPSPLTPALLTDADLDWLRQSRGELGRRLQYKLVVQSDQWLDTSYEFLRRHFGREVLDPPERFRDWLDMNRRGVHPFPFILQTAYVVRERRAWVLGVIAGNLMRVEPSRPDAAKSALRAYVFAIGNQLTEPLARAAGVKGVGTRLWRRAVAEARSITAGLGGRLEYSFLEAENDSVGFWDRMGYRWPRGVTYWQPPLEFDEQGQYVHPEVPEIAMFKPLDVSARRTIGREVIQDVFASVWENWVLHEYRATLSPQAMERAERYVMGTLLDRVESLMPRTPQIGLARIRKGELVPS
jgi:hypothetical protein